MRVVVLVLLLLVAGRAPAAAADRTAALLAQLDSCPADSPQPPLGVLLALADGRSARELGTLIGFQPRGCLGYTEWSGEGDGGLVLIGRMSRSPVDGAVLWIDHGYWRIAAVPLDTVAGRITEQRDGDAREVFLAMGGLGSGGPYGVTVLRLEGSRAAITMRGPSQYGGIFDLGYRLLDHDHFLLQGYNSQGRPMGWTTHWGSVRSYQWLFERRDGRFALVAERQDRDVFFTISAFLGGLFEKEPTLMADVASPAAIARALAIDGVPANLIGLPEYDVDALALERADLMSWDALPREVRVAAPSGVVHAAVPIWNNRPDTIGWVALTLERSSGDWIVTALGIRELHVLRGLS